MLEGEVQIFLHKYIVHADWLFWLLTSDTLQQQQTEHAIEMWKQLGFSMPWNPKLFFGEREIGKRHLKFNSVS